MKSDSMKKSASQFEQIRRLLDAAMVPKHDENGSLSIPARVSWLIQNGLREAMIQPGDKPSILQHALNRSYFGAPYDKDKELARTERQKAYDALGAMLAEHRGQRAHDEERVLDMLEQRNAAQEQLAVLTIHTERLERMCMQLDATLWGGEVKWGYKCSGPDYCGTCPGCLAEHNHELAEELRAGTRPVSNTPRQLLDNARVLVDQARKLCRKARDMVKMDYLEGHPWAFIDSAESWCGSALGRIFDAVQKVPEKMPLEKE